jgi:lambda family phage tail tape measure protein
MVALTFIWEALVALYKPLTLIVIAFVALREGIKAAFDIDILDEFIKGLSWIWSKIKDIIGLEKEKSKVTAQQADIRKIDNELLKEQAVATSKVVDGQRAIALEAKKTLDAYRQQGLSAARNLGISISLIGVDADRAAQIQKMADLETNYLTEVNNLEQKKIELQRAAAAGTAEDQAALASFMGVYKSTLKGIDDEYASQQERLQSLLNVETVLKAREQERLNALDAITKQMERQALLGDQLRSANDKMVDLKFNAKISPLGNPLEGLQPAENDKAGQEVFARIQKSSRAVQVEYAKIQEDARKAAMEAGRAFAAGFEDSGDGLTPEKANELKVGLDKIAKSYKAIADEQVKNLKISRTWQAGWDEAFNAYADSATNAAKMAGDAFNAVTNSMNQAIDNFVMTGKFSFKDMATSIIQDLIKIELKAQAMDIWKMMRGGSSSGGGSVIGTLWDWGKSILGFANGGEPPVGVPSLVGENGPELFIPKSAGTVIPNGGGGKSFDLGTTAKMSAPRPSPSVTRVTNNSTQNTYVTNSISAVDAQSVAQLLMSNKNTIFGIVQQAQKGLPR